MTSPQAAAREGRSPPEPWQLSLFRMTLKKQQKLSAIRRVVGELDQKRCLLVTSGDNNGALNWHFRELGGRWHWSDSEVASAEQIRELTGDPVVVFSKSGGRLEFPGGRFDLVVAIDVHEHLSNPSAFTRELARVTKPGGRVVISTPNGDEKKIAVRLKNLLGMTPQVYGHRVVGFQKDELRALLIGAGVAPDAETGYSRFFTEVLELGINFAYVKLLRKVEKDASQDGQIAPQTQDQLKSIQKTYRIYSMISPLLWAISRLDKLIPFDEGYAVVVAGRKLE